MHGGGSDGPLQKAGVPEDTVSFHARSEITWVTV